MESRLIASTMTYKTCTLERALTKLRENGFTKVELCSAGTFVPHFDMQNATDEDIEKIAEFAEKTGIRIAAINVNSAGNIDQNNYFVGDGFKTVNTAFKLAAKLNCKIVTYLCGNITPGQDRKKRLAAITEFNRIAADIADFYGITYAIEAPHKLTIAEKADEIAEYWAMQDKRVKCTFDVAHFTYSGQDAAEAAKRYAGRTAQVHLRDAVPGNSLLRYGEGKVDFAAIIKIFNDAGYKGCFSMEYPCDSEEESDERIKESIDFFKRFNI